MAGVSPDVRQAWLQEWNRVRKNGTSLRQVAMRLSEEYGFSLGTIRYHLDPAYREREQASHRVSARKSYRRKQDEQRYNRNYHRLTRPRSQERLIDNLFDEHPDEVMTLRRVTEAIRPFVEGVRFREQTVELRFLQPIIQGQRIGRIRGPPYMHRTASGNYVIKNTRPVDTADDRASTVQS